MDIHSIESVSDPSAGVRRLDRRVVWLWTLEQALFWGGMALGLALAALGTAVAGVRTWPAVLSGIAAAVAVTGALMAAWEPRASFRRWSYQLAAEALELRHGVVVHIHSAIPYFRVQHVDVTQGPLERAMGLARLVVHTAAADTDASIPGIAASEAEELRRAILARTGSGDAV